MKKKFFERFEPQHKAVHKSISLESSEWSLLEAYRFYGTHLRGHEISMQNLIREIITDHIQSHRDFYKDKNQWLKKVEQIEEAAQ